MTNKKLIERIQLEEAKAWEELLKKRTEFGEPTDYLEIHKTVISRLEITWVTLRDLMENLDIKMHGFKEREELKVKGQL